MYVECQKCGYVQYVPSRRTSKQSRWLHAALHRFATETGMEFAEAKMWLKNRYGPKEHIGIFDGDDFDERGNHCEHFEMDRKWRFPDWPGQAYRDGQDVWFLRSESAYTRSEETQLGNGLIQECAEAGINIDDLVKGDGK